MPGCDRLAPLAQIVEPWRDEQERAQDDEESSCPVTEGGRFRNVLWHSRRIPIAGSPYWDGDNTYLDLVPGPRGTSGQLVTMVTECDFTVLAPSFRAALTGYVELLESGAWQKQKITGHSAGVFAKLLTRPSANRRAAKKAAR
jgi:cell wall assembly regulator SMI1